MISRPTLNGEAAAVLAQYGKVANMIKWGNKTCIALMIAADVYEIYQSDNKPRAIITKTGGWMGAVAGASIGASYGAAGGTIVPGPGNLIGSFFGGLLGGAIGYISGQVVTSYVYDFLFTKGVDSK